MDIVVLGLGKRFITELSDVIRKEINCMSVCTRFDVQEFFHQDDLDLISVLLVEVNLHNFKICFQLADKVIEKHSNVIIIFICDHTLPAWQKEASDRGIYWLDRKKSYLEMVAQISKMMRWKNSEACEFEFEEALTPKEEEVIKLAASGLKQGEIAEDLGISRKTVQNHLARISEKLNTTSQMESVMRAIELGIIAVNYEISEEFES